MTADAAVSAPGKVLLTGGYLVLEHRFSGLVVAVDARFVVRTCALHPPRPAVHVRSPQFVGGLWDYSVSGETHPFCIAASGSSKNPFVEAAIANVLLVLGKCAPSNAAELVRAGCAVTIVADNDYYSQTAELKRRGLAPSVESLASLPKHSPFGTSIDRVNKTGLGSSAAMVTALVASLLSYFGVVDIATINEPENDAQRALVHNVAQLAHCIAQGKVGSGFDVSAAVNGSHFYKRFSPDLLDPVFTAISQRAPARVLAQHVQNVVSTKWDCETASFSLPHGLSLMLGDVIAGSSTPKLVSKVLEWRHAHPDESEKLWYELNRLNNTVAMALTRLVHLHKCYPEEYSIGAAQCALWEGAQWTSLLDQVEENVQSTIVCFADVYATFKKVRMLLQTMTKSSGAAVEPPEQTKLLDACMKIPGVLMAGVPGAGGYDAIFCIVLSEESKQNVQALWAGWTDTQVIPLLQKEAKQGLALVP